MYNKFHKGELIKSETTIDSTFPANREIELWKNTELKRFEVLERPVISLFENDVEHERFVQDLIKGLYLGRDIDDSKNFNSILYGCELDKETLTNGDVYTTLTPGIFIYENKVYQIYPTCYIASRQLEKEAELTTENGLEYINIKYENEKFSADIKVGSYPKEKISGDITRGIVLLEKIKTYLDGKIAYRHSGHEVPEVINISTSLEKFQLEPVFKSTTTKQWVKFNGTEIINENLGPNVSEQFIFGGHHKNDDMDFKDVKKWAGFNTSVYKKYSVTNEKLDYMPSLTLKGNILGNNEHPADLEKESIVSSFQLVTTDTLQSIEETKTFTADQEIENDINLVFKNSSGEHGWNIKNNASDSLLIIKGEATPEAILTIKNDKDVSFATKDFSIDGTSISLTGKTTLLDELDVSGATTLSDTLDVTGKTTLLDELDVSGATTLSDTLDVTGKTTLLDELEVGEATTLSDTLDVTGKTTLLDELDVSGATTLNNITDSSSKDNGALIVKGGVGIAKNLNVGVNASIGGTLGVTGNTSLTSLSITGNTTVGGTLGVKGDFKVNDDKFIVTAATGNTAIGGTLGVTGNTSLTSLSITGNTTVGGTLGVDGASTLESLSITGNTTVGGTLGVDGASTLASLSVIGNTTVGGTLDVSNNLKIKTNKFIVTAATGNTTIGGTLEVASTSTFTGQITATGGITSPSDIKTTDTGSISSETTITAGTNIISTTGDLVLKKGNFLIGLGNPTVTTYDWSIGKTSTTEIGSLEIKNSGNPSNGTFYITDTGLVKALQFETNGDYTLNNLNVEKFNGHTIVNTAISSTTNGTDQILWVANGGTVINRTTFTSLPTAKSTDDGDAVNMNGLMPSGSLKRIATLEGLAGLTVEGGVNLIGTVNEKGVDVGEGGGGNVTIYGSDISISDSVSATIATRLSDNAAELTRLATHVPVGSNNTTTPTGENKVIISVEAGGKPVWSKITDDQISSTLTRIAPVATNSVLTRTLGSNEYPVALWHTTGNTLASSSKQHNDVVYNTSNSTLTATNVTSRSSRALKKDIEIYKESAFDTLDKIDIVSFHFKDDATQADKVGFIAEDSPSLVAGLNHDKMDMNNCIGLLIKAVQELREENKELRNELNNIRNS